MSDVVVASLGAIIVALITAIPVTLSAWTNRRRINEIHANVGSKNGDGDLIHMSERLLAWQEDFDGMRAELVELNRYSHDWKHDIISKLTALYGVVTTLWNESHPDNPIDLGGDK